MLVQQVVMPGSRRRSWTVLGPDGVPVEPVERYLAFLTDVDRSPNTVKAYTHDLAPPVPASSRSRPARVGRGVLSTARDDELHKGADALARPSTGR